MTDTDDTELGRIIQPIAAGKPEGESGFLTMLNGIDALAARLMLAARAEQIGVDVQIREIGVKDAAGTCADPGELCVIATPFPEAVPRR